MGQVVWEVEQVSLANMSFLIITWGQFVKPPDNIEHLVINKLDVSAVYSQIQPDRKSTIAPLGTLVLIMKSGKEFRFEYVSHLMAKASCMTLSLAIQFKTTSEIEI
jgi:hypothetical protein